MSKLTEEIELLEKLAACAHACECGQIKATLMVNYGPEGRTQKGVIDQPMGSYEAMVVVLKHLELQRKGIQ